jgi:ribonuclease HII
VIIVGIDEVGRGCVAGPVIAAAVVIDLDRFDINVKDSKKLTLHQRNRLEKKIKVSCLDFSIGIVDEKKIDQINIHNASLLAMKIAYDNLNKKSLIVRCDGKFTPNINADVFAIINGDNIHKEISAASIIAKNYRDNYMSRMSNYYPGYSFVKNKGYLTKIHMDAISKLGPCDIHRKTFKPFS